MKSKLATVLLGSTLLLATGAQLVIPMSDDEFFPTRPTINHNRRDNLDTPAQRQPQYPMAGPSDSKENAPKIQSTTILSDVLDLRARINIYASFTRDVSTVAARLEDAAANTTVLAPLNIAIRDLPRKPWESPADYAKHGSQAAYLGDDGEKRAYENLRRFTEAHIVPLSPWEEGEKVSRMTGKEGDEVWWERTANGDRKIMPDGVIVEDVVSKVGNGEIWAIEGVLNYRV